MVDSSHIPLVHEDSDHYLSDWFDHFRAERRAYREQADPVAGAKRRRAVITMVHNESFFFPIWLAYYSRFFGRKDIHVLDNDTTDGSTKRRGFKRTKVHRDEVDHAWMVERIEEKQHALFEAGYEQVIVTDVDELVVPHPSLGDLGDYMNHFDEEFVNCIGYEIVHLPDREPPFDPGRPILQQRSYWMENAHYNKSALAMKPSRWEPGFHRRLDGHFRPDPDLFMVHLHRVDYQVCLDRHLLRKRRQWNPEDLDAEWAAHNLVTEREEFDHWFFHETGIRNMADPDELLPARIQRIPDDLKGAF